MLKIQKIIFKIKNKIMANPEHHYLLEQRNWAAYDTLLDATTGILFKTNGILVYIISEDTFYYWNESLADWIALSGNGSSLPPKVLEIQGDGLLYSVPAGYTLESILVINNGVSIDINLGTAALGSQILNAATMTGGASTNQSLGYSSGVGLSTFNVYISGSAWIGVSLDIYIILKQIV